MKERAKEAQVADSSNKNHQKKGAWFLLKSTVNEFLEDKVLRLSAALAYYSIFSLGPLLIVIIGIAGLAFGEDRVRQEVQAQLKDLLGPNAADVGRVLTSSQQKSTTVVATVVGTVALLIGASGVFGQLQDSLNTIWEVKPKPGQGIWGFIRSRFLSLAMVLGTGFLLLLSMVLTAFVTMFTGYLESVFSIPKAALFAGNLALSFVIITLLFAMIFKYLPDVKIKWRDVWIGALGTAFLFIVGKYLLGLYLGRQGTASGFGAASSIVVVLMYIYYSSLILFFGAEFTQVYARQTGSEIRPTEYAVPVTDDERAQQGMPRPERVEESPAEKNKPVGKTPSRGSTLIMPREALRQNPVTFVAFGLAVGIGTGLLLRSKVGRTLLRLWVKPV